MIRKLTPAFLIFLSMHAFADGDDGEYLGFKLGDRFSVPRGVVGKDYIMGALTFNVDPGRHPHHILRYFRNLLRCLLNPKTKIFSDISFFATPDIQEYTFFVRQTKKKKRSPESCTHPACFPRALGQATAAFVHRDRITGKT